MVEIQVLLVVETDKASKTDDAYYSYLLRVFFGQYLSLRGSPSVLIQYHFVYMGGAGNHHSPKVQSEIKGYRSLFKKGPTFVVYCFDVDRLGLKDIAAIREVVSTCKAEGSFVSLTNPEIETLFQLENAKNRVWCARHFTQHNPKKEKLKWDWLSASGGEVLQSRMRTNFCKVIQTIIDGATPE